MDVKDCISEAHRQLNNKDHYKILNNDPTATNAKFVNYTIQRFKKEKLPKEKIADGLKVSNPKTPKFQRPWLTSSKLSDVPHFKYF